MVTAVEERLEMANNRKDLGGQEASARIHYLTLNTTTEEL